MKFSPFNFANTGICRNVCFLHFFGLGVGSRHPALALCPSFLSRRRFSFHQKMATKPEGVEPYKDLWFENERVRLCNVVTPYDKEISWVCPHPTIRWLVGGGEFTETKTDANGVTTSEKQILPDKSVRYYEADPNAKYTLRNECWRSIRELVFELLDKVPRYTPEQVEMMRKACVYSPNVGTTLLFENDRCRAWDFSFPPGGGDAKLVHQHTMDYIFVTPCDGPPPAHGAPPPPDRRGAVRLIGYNPDGTVQFDGPSRDGDVTWTTVERGGFQPDGVTPKLPHSHAGRNGFEDRPFVEYLLEIK